MRTPLENEQLSSRVLSKVIWRLIPFMFLLFVLNIVDRTNVGFARLQMLAELELSEKAFAWGSGIFFIGYFLFQVPSNLILNRIGARLWIAGIVVAWGLLSSAMMFIRDEWSFYTLRFLLGIAQSGFFPGMILYLTYWIPARDRAKATACFMSASAVAGVVGGPVSGALMQYLDKAAGLPGWQWMFLLEGLPTVVLGFVSVFWLTDRPELAQWLDSQERAWLSDQMTREAQQRQQQHGITLKMSMANPRVWMLCLLYFLLVIGISGFVFYLPKLINESFPKYSPAGIGLLTAIPYVLSVICMISSSIHSDRSGERRWHVAVPALLAAIGWVVSAYSRDPWIVLAALSVAGLGMYSTFGPFWALPNSFLTGAAAAGGIALINSFGNLGGFVAPMIFGEFKTSTGSFTGALLAMGVSVFLGGILALCCPHQRAWEQIER